MDQLDTFFLAQLGWFEGNIYRTLCHISWENTMEITMETPVNRLSSSVLLWGTSWEKLHQATACGTCPFAWTLKGSCIVRDPGDLDEIPGKTKSLLGRITISNR